MADRRGVSQAWPLFVVCALAALAGAMLAFWIGGARKPRPKPPADRGEEIHTDAIDPPVDPRIPLPRLERLVATSDDSVCAIGGGAIACSDDAGRTWAPAGEVDARVLAILQSTDGRRVVAADDGAVYTLERDGTVARRRLLPPDARGEIPQVVDAQARDGRLWILAHRFDRPDDPLKLPRVVRTVVFTADEDTVAEAVSSKGFTGDRLLLGTRGGGVTFASVDARAWSFTEGTSALHRIPDARRFGASFGDLQVSIERWAERLEGPGRPARAASRLVVSRDDGATWRQVFETQGEVLVDFRDEEVGLVVARDEATAWLTTDGAAQFRPVHRDDRLHDAVSVVHVGARFLIGTADAHLAIVEP